MRNISVGTSFFIRRPVFWFFFYIHNNKLTHRHCRQSRFPWSKNVKVQCKKYTWHNIIKRERKDKSWNKNRNTQNPFFFSPFGTPFASIGSISPERHSQNTTVIHQPVCVGVYSTSRESFMPNLVSGQLCLAVQLGPNNHTPPVCRCTPSFCGVQSPKRTSTPTPSLCKAPRTVCICVTMRVWSVLGFLPHKNKSWNILEGCLDQLKEACTVQNTRELKKKMNKENKIWQSKETVHSQDLYRRKGQKENVQCPFSVPGRAHFK